MTPRLRLPLAVVAVLASSAVLGRAASRELCRGFVPENDLDIPVGSILAASGVTEEAFNRVLDRVEAVYRPVVAAKGGRLVVNRLWKDGKVNASAQQPMFGKKDVWTINMYGGLARHKAITEAGFALVACHEMGHHLGGAPKLSGLMARYLGLGRWATNEGGSDYFATLKCLREVLPEGAPEQVDPAAAAGCDAAHADPLERSRCRSGAMAGASVAALFQALMPRQPMPSFTTPDASKVSAMADGHPLPQCRLDTYFQGALCARPIFEGLSDTDVDSGACTRKKGFAVGLRPACWYKAPKDEPAAQLIAASALPPDTSSRVSDLLDASSAAFADLR